MRAASLDWHEHGSHHTLSTARSARVRFEISKRSSSVRYLELKAGSKYMRVLGATTGQVAKVGSESESVVESAATARAAGAGGRD